ncbi:MAG: amidase [Rhizobiaceae bacterium]|jgi:Asp-tRNA(Asn)/Glu-tRNA(Gln) amidotransferase A subunit family amidase|nr:amidase [Rhizobiaceae bacterium]
MHDEVIFPASGPIRLTRLAKAIGEGEITAQNVVQECLARIIARDPAIGAFAAIQHVPQWRNGPLLGIPIGVKDIFDTHDLPTEYGSAIFAGHRPSVDAAIVAMLRRAGAAIIGKTVTTEFAFLHPAATRNPLNLAHTPGGSSSGSAAAVAAGMVLAAIGTQTGGSIIRPASYCGIAGYKPSFRLLPTTGMKTFSWSLDTAGFFAATVADVAFLAAAVTGRPLALEPAHSRFTFGVLQQAVHHEADNEMLAALERAAQALSRAGHAVQRMAEPAEWGAARNAHSTLQDFEAALALGDELDRFPDMLSDRLRTTLEAGRAISPADFDTARRTARLARKASPAVFDGIDALLTPSAPGAAPFGLASTGDSKFNKLFTLLGLPAMNVPGLNAQNGLPLGMQVIAPFGRDGLALQAANALESALRSADHAS